MSDWRRATPPPSIVSVKRPRNRGAVASRASTLHFPLQVSHPVPPLPQQPRALRAPAVLAMSLTADRTLYLVTENEFPTYVVTGAEPNQTILWSLWQDGVLVVEDQPFGKVTDAGGNWFGIGSPWLDGHAGFWDVLAKAGNRQASISFVVATAFSEYPPAPPAAMLGVTHVAGHYRFATPDSELRPSSFLAEGARHVRNLGARHLFAYLTPQYRDDYPFDDFGRVEYTSLTALASSPEYDELFRLPFDTIVLTAYTFSNWQWILRRGGADPVPFDADAEREELAGLVRHLTASYPEKIFILKNWEGDWQLRMSFDIDAVASEEQVAEFIAWMRARHEGIVQGRGSSPAPRVQDAIEFNLIHQAQRGLPSMLASVIPHAGSDLVAYASWWSLGRPGAQLRNLRDDIAFIRGMPGIGDRPLIISEFGVSYQLPDNGPRTRQAVEAFSLAGVPLAFYWQIFDNGPALGLVSQQAVRHDSWHTVRALLGVSNDAAFVHEETRLPERVIAGQQYPVVIAVRNLGSLFDPVVGYALGLLDTQGMLARVVWVRSEVPVGEVVTLSFMLDAPSTTGLYVFRMFQHGVELFGEELPIEVHPPVRVSEPRP